MQELGWCCPSDVYLRIIAHHWHDHPVELNVTTIGNELAEIRCQPIGYGDSSFVPLHEEAHPALRE